MAKVLDVFITFDTIPNTRTPEPEAYPLIDICGGPNGCGSDTFKFTESGRLYCIGCGRIEAL